MPRMNFPSEFGNLIVKFDVKFPTSLQVQYCTVLYCTILYYTVLHCTILYYTVLHCTILYYTVLY
jgi:hypothetical protein